jgi:L-rhamnose mutarotase
VNRIGNFPAFACVLALCLGATGCLAQKPRVQRYGMVIGVRPDKIEEYKRLHAAVWPEIISKLRQVNVRNYSIYLAEVEKGKWYLFSYWEYTGSDFKADMARMAADPKTHEWWKLTDPCQEPVPTRKEGEQWAIVEEVFHMD